MVDHITGNTTFSKTIEIIVSPNGETRLETKGFSGAECREASKFVEEALGTNAAEQMTAEFYESHASCESTRLAGGKLPSLKSS